MDRVRVVLLVALFGVAASVAAGDLWIICEPGLEIYLDEEPAGVSDKAEFGRILRGINEGDHTIRIQKEGVAPKEFSINVGVAANQIVVGALSPEISGEPTGASENEPEKKPVGMIVITSNPMEINVKFAGQHVPKIKPIMTFPTVHVGEHKLWFESSGTILSETVDVQEGTTVDVKVDFSNQLIAVTGSTPDVPSDDSAGEEKGTSTEPECIEYWMQVMRTSNIEDIEAARSALKSLGFPDYRQKVITIEEDGTLPTYKIRVGPVPRKSETKYPVFLLRRAGFKNVWVVPEECQINPQPTPKPTYKPIL
jgi:hypothetical protein